MMTFIFAVALALFQDTIPFKPGEEFEVKLDYQFKPRPAEDHNTVHLADRPSYSRNTSAVLPYVTLQIKVLSLPSEKARVAITNNLSQRPSYKKVALNSVLELDLGFTVDMIDRVQPHEHTLTFTDDARRAVNRILISVEEDGTFLVNGEKRGKF